MKINQYIHNRIYQKSKENSIFNLNISIITTIDSVDQLAPKNYQVLQQNGLETFFLMQNTRNSAHIIETEKLPFGNWIILSCRPSFSLTALLNEIKKEIKREYVFLVNNIENLNTITIEDLTTLSTMANKYKNHFISTNCENKAILFSKNDINKITSFSLPAYGLNDESIEITKRSLELSGIKEIYIRNFHSLGLQEIDFNNESSNNDTTNLQNIKYQYYNNIFYTSPSIKRTIIEKIYNYCNKEQTYNQLINFLNTFETYDILDPLFYKKKYQKIVLVQSYNESNNIIDFFDNMGHYFDGIIMLDDESTDGTYNMALHEKLILKVRKKRKIFFDLENRNILLKLSSFYHVEWLCFMDFDERINSKFADFSFINNINIDTVAFNVVHLWDDPNLFNASFPGTYKGVEKIFRMFRNIGYSQIKSSKKFHFAATPYFGKQYFNSGLLVMHHAFLDEKKRRQKYEFYTQNDPLSTPNQYDYLINNCVQLNEIENISIDDLLNTEYINYLDK